MFRCWLFVCCWSLALTACIDEADDLFERLAAYSEDEGGGDSDDGGGDRDDGSDDGGQLAALQDRYDAVADQDRRKDNLAMARRVLACVRKRDAREAGAANVPGADSDDAPTFQFLLCPTVVISFCKFYILFPNIPDSDARIGISSTLGPCD